MPFVNFHLVQGRSSPAQQAQLLTGASRLYASILDAPMERVRVFITERPAGRVAVAGEVVEHSGLHAPYFEFIVMRDRTAEQRQRLMAAFTGLLVETLAVDPAFVRGCCQRVDPEDWCIGGRPASEVRSAEIAARAAANGVAVPATD